MKSLVKNMVLLVEGIKDEPTKRILMKRCERMIPYLPGLEKQGKNGLLLGLWVNQRFKIKSLSGKKMIKAATSAWVASEEDGTVIRAFLLLHQLGRAHEGVHAEEVWWSLPFPLLHHPETNPSVSLSERSSKQCTERTPSFPASAMREYCRELSSRANALSKSTGFTCRRPTRSPL